MKKRFYFFFTLLLKKVERVAKVIHYKCINIKNDELLFEREIPHEQKESGFSIFRWP